MSEGNHKVLEMPKATEKAAEDVMGRSLSLAERLALQAVQGQLAQAQGQLRALLQDMGLDPNRNWRMTPDGMLLPA